MSRVPGETANLAADVVHAIASMRTGTLIECDARGTALRRLEELAAIAPSVFGTSDLSPVDKVLGRLAGDGARPSLREVLMLSAEYVNVLRPLARTGFALVATSPISNSVGLVLSIVRERALEVGTE